MEVVKFCSVGAIISQSLSEYPS